MIAFALSAFAAAIFRKITCLWGMFDDPFHFNILKPVTRLGTLYDKTLYDALGTPIFTRFFMLSLKGDLSMFGQNARDFYMHQLLVVMLLPAAEYCCYACGVRARPRRRKREGDLRRSRSVPRDLIAPSFSNTTRGVALA